MDNKTLELCSLYNMNNNKNKYASDETNIIEFTEKEFNNYKIIATLMNVNNKYLIFINIEQEEKIIFNGLLYESEQDLRSKYSIITCDLNLLSYEEFISKYYELLKNNF